LDDLFIRKQKKSFRDLINFLGGMVKNAAFIGFLANLDNQKIFEKTLARVTLSDKVSVLRR
jgi:hypothetical protein